MILHILRYFFYSYVLSLRLPNRANVCDSSFLWHVVHDYMFHKYMLMLVLPGLLVGSKHICLLYNADLLVGFLQHVHLGLGVFLFFQLISNIFVRVILLQISYNTNTRGWGSSKIRVDFLIVQS
jgi:hypothetical protein